MCVRQSLQLFNLGLLTADEVKSAKREWRARETVARRMAGIYLDCGDPVMARHQYEGFRHDGGIPDAFVEATPDGARLPIPPPLPASSVDPEDEDDAA